MLLACLKLEVDAPYVMVLATHVTARMESVVKILCVDVGVKGWDGVCA